jgi:hypothetical protein
MNQSAASLDLAVFTSVGEQILQPAEKSIHGTQNRVLIASDLSAGY